MNTTKNILLGLVLILLTQCTQEEVLINKDLDAQTSTKKGLIEPFPKKVKIHIATGNANFTPRRGHTTIVFDDKLWVIGGQDRTISDGWWHDEFKNDVWYSTNGIDWIEATANANFSPRSDHTTVVYDNKIWVMGGKSENGINMNDVWYSNDGINWIEATSNAPWSKRHEHTSVVYQNKIWVIGGWNGNYNNNDFMWSSNNGINWIKHSASAFSVRHGHSSIVYNNNMFIIAGISNSGFENDILSFGKSKSSNDFGNPKADFSPRVHHTTTVFDNKIWTISGLKENSNIGDIWYSDDVLNWTRIFTSNSPIVLYRYNHTVTVYKNRLWIIGGIGNLNIDWPKNDVLYINASKSSK